MDSTGARICDVRPSPDGRRLVYVLEPSGGSPAELHCRNLDDGVDTILVRAIEGLPARLACAGWLAPGSLVVARSTLNDDWSRRAEVLVVETSGTRRHVATIERTFPGAARLDPNRQVLYLTLVRSDDGCHDLGALDLKSGHLERLTDNQVPGTSFSGISILADGSILYSRHQQSQSIWSIRFAE